VVYLEVGSTPSLKAQKPSTSPFIIKFGVQASKQICWLQLVYHYGNGGGKGTAVAAEQTKAS